MTTVSYNNLDFILLKMVYQSQHLVNVWGFQNPNFTRIQFLNRAPYRRGNRVAPVAQHDRSVYFSQHGDEEWSLPVPEITAVLSAGLNYSNVSEVNLGEAQNRLCVHGSVGEYRDLGLQFQECFRKVTRLSIHVNSRDSVDHMLAFLEVFKRPKTYVIKLNSGSMCIELFNSALFSTTARSLTMKNQLNSQELNFLAPPMSSSNRTLESLNIATALNPCNLVEAGSRLAETVLHFQCLCTFTLRGSSMFNQFLPPFLLRLQEHSTRKNNLLRLQFPDMDVNTLTDECKEALLCFLDRWKACPIGISFAGSSEFYKSMKVRAASYQVAFHQELHVPNNQHIQNFLTILDSVNKYKSAWFDNLVEEEYAAANVAFILLREFPGLLQHNSS